MKNALEPSWEARFEANSYGFRPGRGVHDGIEQSFIRLGSGKDMWILEADIKGCFDNISHEYILKAIGQVPGRELIKQWLQAGYVESQVFHETESGTPQGGIISPQMREYSPGRYGRTRIPIRKDQRIQVLSQEKGKIQGIKAKVEEIRVHPLCRRLHSHRRNERGH